jgi:NTE family protein
MTKHETVVVLQGGGALGAYECGVYKALEERGILPDLVAGVSIGAVNAAIIAGNPHGRAARALDAFWNEIAVPDPPIPDGELRRFVAAWQIALFGVPAFFTPRWLSPSWRRWWSARSPTKREPTGCPSSRSWNR